MSIPKVTIGSGDCDMCERDCSQLIFVDSPGLGVSFTVCLKCWERLKTKVEKQVNAQQRHAAGAKAKPCLCDDCEVGNCDMRGEAVECSGKVTSSGTASA